MIRWLNALGVLVAFALGMSALGLQRDEARKVDRSALSLADDAELEFTSCDDGKRCLVDLSGRAIPLVDYQHIASGSTIADALLLEFVSPNRIAAFTQYSTTNALFGHRYADKPQVDAIKNMERLLSLSPDLLIISTLSSETRLQRLRDAGLNVFVLGEMRGVESFLRSVHMVATLAGRPELGQLYARTFRQRLEEIARGLPQKQRKTAAQLTYYGKKIYGSGRGTSYHDVMTYAGLIDVGAKHYEGWPSLSIEQVLELDPQVILTRDDMGESLCSHGALSKLQACAHEQAGIVELPDALINDPGPMMLPSAELIYDAVYGEH